MSVVVLALMLWALHRNLRDFCLKHRLILAGLILLYIAGLFLHTRFLVSKGWEYGISGADMASYFRAATRIARGARWDQLSKIGVMRFTDVQLNTIGYFVFAQYLSWLLYHPVVIDMMTTLYVVYLTQLLMIFCAAVNFGRVFSRTASGAKRMTAAVLILTCVSFAVSAYQLMRDAYLMWGLSILCREVLSLRRDDPKGNRLRWVRIGLLTTVCCVLRFYSLLIIVPFTLTYGVNRRGGAVFGLAVTAVLLVGSSLILLFREALKVTWQFGSVAPYETFQYLIFPNIVNQTKYILNWERYFGNATYLSGCNLPGVYYLMSVWNVALFPAMLIGIVRTAKTRTPECVMWLTMLLNMCMLYSLVYTSIDTRQKLMIALPICFFSLEGFGWLRSKGALFVALYGFAVALIVWGCFAIA